MGDNKSKAVYERLNSVGLRLFKIRLRRAGSTEDYLFLSSRTVSEWRRDVRAFYHHATVVSDAGDADSKILNEFMQHLEALGYVFVEDVATDVFDCSVANERARIVDDADDADQLSGFGRYGMGLSNTGEPSRVADLIPKHAVNLVGFDSVDEAKEMASQVDASKMLKPFNNWLRGDRSKAGLEMLLEQQDL